MANKYVRPRLGYSSLTTYNICLVVEQATQRCHLRVLEKSRLAFPPILGYRLYDTFDEKTLHPITSQGARQKVK